ncbi:DUF4079 family protein [Desulfocurvus sp. DL9XJH121]
MLWIHPVLQLLSTLAALYVLWLGIARFRCNHMGCKLFFDWKAHVRWGRAVIIVWFAMLALGVAMTRASWGMAGITGAHYIAGLATVPFMAAGYATGSYLDRVKKRRKALPLIHGLCNTALLALALYQVWSGVGAVRLFLLP